MGRLVRESEAGRSARVALEQKEATLREIDRLGSLKEELGFLNMKKDKEKLLSDKAFYDALSESPQRQKKKALKI